MLSTRRPLRIEYTYALVSARFADRFLRSAYLCRPRLMGHICKSGRAKEYLLAVNEHCQPTFTEYCIMYALSSCEYAAVE